MSVIGPRAAAKGLERLGSEPEETEDLIKGDLGVALGGAGEARAFIFGLFEAAIDEGVRRK